MPRVVKSLLAPGAVHVVHRGDARQDVFHDYEDYHSFLDLLKVAKDRYGIKLYSYCLMPNHFHLFLETDNTSELSRFMQWLTSSYVHKFRRRHSVLGRVLQGRYQSFPVLGELDYLTVMQYIESNPVRTGMVGSAASYPWSSHRASVWGVGNVPLDKGPMEVPEDWTQQVDQSVQRDDFNRAASGKTDGVQLGAHF